MPAHPTDNPEGYHESRWLVEISNSFLQAIGSHWDPGALPRGAFHGANTRCAIPADHRILLPPSGTLSCLKDPTCADCRATLVCLYCTTAKHVFVTRVVRHPDEICLAAQEGVGCRLKAAAIDPPSQRI